MTEQTTALVRFEDPAGVPVVDEVAGLNPLTPALGAYPKTALAMATAVGYGTWTTGYLLDETTTPLAATFGAPALALAAGTPIYRAAGPLGAADFGVGFTAGAGTSFSGGNVFNVSGTDDLVIAWVGYHSAIPAAIRTVIGKGVGGTPFYGIVVDNVGNLSARVNDGATLYTSQVAMPIGKWYVGVAVVDRGAAKLRLATITLDGVTSAIGAATAVPANAFAAGGNLLLGASLGLDGCDHATFSALWIGSGAGVALNMSANLAAAAANLRTALIAKAPTQESGVAGFAAVFSVGAALSAGDQTTGATALPRDVTVQALVRWDLAAQTASGKNGTLIARGRGDVATEYMPFAIEFVPIDATTGQLRFLWQTAAGVLKTEVGGGFINPAGQYMMVTATRRWQSLTSVVIRYYIGGVLLAEVASADGDIASSASGTTYVGARFVSPSVSNFFCGAVDELRVLNYEMSAEEIRAIYHRIATTQPDGVRQFRELLPPGLPVTDDPSSRVQQDFASGGAALGFADGLIENFRRNLMPDRAYGDVARRWESITRQPAGLADSLDVRRKRVLGHLGSRQGASVTAVEAALAASLQCNATDLVPVGFDDSYRDTFATLDAQRWFTPLAGTVDVITNELRLQCGSGLSRMWNEVSPLQNAIAALLPLNVRASGLRNNSRESSPSVFAVLDIQTLGTNVESGIVIASWSRGSMIFFGVQNSAGTRQLVYQRYKLNVASDAAPVVIAGWDLTAPSLRIVPTPGAIILGSNERGYDLSFQSVGTPAWSAPISLACDASMDWFGVYMRTFNSGATSGSASDVRYTAASIFRDNYSDRAFFQYMYRNPALGGSPDIAGANRIFQRMRHGYTKAAVITSMSMLCDDAGSLCDAGPMGGI